MPKTKYPWPNELAIAYSIRQDRKDQVQLRWLDKPAKAYIVQHLANGSIRITPEDEATYIVKATDDDLLQLRQFASDDGYLDVRHDVDGVITLRPRECAEEFGKHFDERMTKKANPIGIPDEYCRVYEFLRDFPHKFVIFRPTLSPESRCVAHVHDTWDRTGSGFKARPKELEELEIIERWGVDELERMRAWRERCREKDRAAYQRRKAKKLGAAAQALSGKEAATLESLGAPT